MILGLYNQMIAGAADQLCSALMDALQPAQREAQILQDKLQIVKDQWDLLMVPIQIDLRQHQKFQCVMQRVLHQQ